MITTPIINNYIREIWEVRFRDIDPDTGYDSQNRLIAFCLTQMDAEKLRLIIERDYMQQEQNPNREFYVNLVKLEFSEII